MCFNIENYEPKIVEAQTFLQKNNIDFGVQLHNSATPELVEKLYKFVDTIKFTIHSPLLSDYFLNLAYSDYDFIKNQCQHCIELLKKFRTNIFFFHGFFLTNELIKHNMQHYRRVMRESIPAKYSLENSFIMNPEIFDTPEFNDFENRFINNLSRLKIDFSDVILALENDFPGIGSGLQRPKEIKKHIDNLWLDLGHLWCSALLHNFDFYAVIDELIATKNICGVHINHNLSDNQTLKTKIIDTHSHIYTPCAQNLKPVIRKLINANIKLLTLEIVDGDILDIKTLVDWF